MKALQAGRITYRQYLALVLGQVQRQRPPQYW